MAPIQIDTEEVRNVASQFQTKKGEMEAMIQQARSMMNNLRGGYRGIRADKTFGEWEGMQQNLTNAIQTLQVSGEILSRAAADFTTADTNF